MELGMNHAGEIRTLVAAAEPDVRVWTNVGDAHLGFFASADAIADAKAEILEHARPSDLLVVNADDDRIGARARAFAGRTLTFGLSDAADVRASGVRHRGLDGMAATVTGHGRRPRGPKRRCCGTRQSAESPRRVAVAMEMGRPALGDLAERAATMKPAARPRRDAAAARRCHDRGRSYNSSPAALNKSARDGAAATGRRAEDCRAREMLELGPR